MVKSFNRLFEKVIEDANLEAAILTPVKQKIRGKARKTAQYILEHLDETKQKLKEMLLNKEFRAIKHRVTLIHDGSSKKARLILKPELRFEQMVHHAVVQVLQPIFMRGMYEFSCGSIPGRGPHYGKKFIEKFIHNRPADIKYVLKFDIKKFYPSIDTDILKQKLRRIIHDEKMMFLLEQIIDSTSLIAKKIRKYSKSYAPNSKVIPTHVFALVFRLGEWWVYESHAKGFKKLGVPEGVRRYTRATDKVCSLYHANRS